MKKGFILVPVFFLICGLLYLANTPRMKPTGKHEPGWPVLPNGFKLGEPSGLAVDAANGNVVVLHRAGREWPLLGPMPKNTISENTITVFNGKSGAMLRNWGSNRFIMPHGLNIDKNGNYWITDVGLHQVFKFSSDGKLLLKLGEAGVPGNDISHFDKPTAVAVAEDGRFYVSDGYGNSRIVEFSAEGKYLKQWGNKGSGDGEFDIPHGIALDSAGYVYVADRENKRIQVFTPEGHFVRKITSPNFGKITAVTFDENGMLYAADDANLLGIIHRGSVIFAVPYNAPPIVLASGLGWFHALSVDSAGNLYTGDIANESMIKFLNEHNPRKSKLD